MNMILVLASLVLASLVLVGTAGAEERCDMNITMQGRTAVQEAQLYREHHECMMSLAERQNVIGSGTGQVTYPAEQTTCEQKMQAAMEAVDPYVLKGMTIKTDDPEFDRKVWDGWLIYKQWADAKTCWRK